ncbi:MAG: glutathione S-transferase N-terminal domain-containing protein [Rhodospirillales bacterium]|nr:MAG: glutathione S-transferase N-terminal domain-containing protein [Rhodospirillales bacterium]
MKLFWSSRSPFVRKVMVVAHETGVAGRIVCERTIVAAANPNRELMTLNPLGKLPTLLLDDGAALYDSRVICEFLDTLHAGRRLFPVDPARRVDALRRQALGDGAMDMLILRLSERARPEARRSPELMAGFALKRDAILAALEAMAPALAAIPYDIGHVAIGCALSYLDFRFAEDSWRSGRPALAAWHADFAARPSVAATEHVDAY